MKTIEELLRNLARPEVLEFGLVTNRLPSVNIGGKFEPVDDEAPGNERLLQMLVTMGGGRHIDDLGEKPVQWSTRLDGVGVIAVAAIARNDVIQARFTITKRDGLSVRPPSGRQAVPARPPSGTSTAVRPSVPAPSKPPSAPRVSVRPIQALASEPLPLFDDDGDDNEPTLQTQLPPAKTGASPKLAGSQDERSAPTDKDLSEHAAAARAGAAASAERAAPDTSAAIDAFLSLAVSSRASELFLVANRPMVLRVAGDLLTRTQVTTAEQVERIVTQTVPQRLVEALERDGSCHFAHAHPTLGRFRVTVAKQRTGFKLNVRLVPSELPARETLGLSDAVLGALRLQSGLVLVTGLAGHGKTTTLAVLVDYLNRETARHILTIEQPIEYVHASKKALVSQREVGIHGASQAEMIATALRGADVDVLVLGELTDTDTVRQALIAAESGRLVLGTLNAASTTRAVEGLLELFSPAEDAWVRSALASSLRLLVGQRLVPSPDRTRLHVAVELVPWSVPLFSLLREGRIEDLPELNKRGRAVGVVRLDESLAELVRSQKVTPEVAKQHAESPAELDALAASRMAAMPALQVRKA